MLEQKYAELFPFKTNHAFLCLAELFSILNKSISKEKNKQKKPTKEREQNTQAQKLRAGEPLIPHFFFMP